MKDYFDNRKPAPEAGHQSSRTIWMRIYDSIVIFSSNSKRGKKWRFRLLCAAAILLAAILYMLQDNIGVKKNNPNPLLHNDNQLSPSRLLDR